MKLALIKHKDAEAEIFFDDHIEAMMYVDRFYPKPLNMTTGNYKLLNNNIIVNVTKSGREYYKVRLTPPTKTSFVAVGGSN